MTNLIVSIIAIALAALTIIAVAYYGGSAFNNRGEQAVVGRLINEGEQIKGAIDYYRVEHGNQVPDNLTTLVNGNYLVDVPKGAQDKWSLNGTKSHAITILPADSANYTKCLSLRTKVGFNAEANCNTEAQAVPSNEQCLRVCYNPADSTPRTNFSENLNYKDPCCIDNSTSDPEGTVGAEHEVILP